MQFFKKKTQKGLFQPTKSAAEPDHQKYLTNKQNKTNK